MGPSTKDDGNMTMKESMNAKFLKESSMKESTKESSMKESTNRSSAKDLNPIMKKYGRAWHKQDTKGESMIMHRDPTLKQGYLGNLSSKTLVELEEVIAREDKLLRNVKFISMLPDKGARIRNRRSEMMQALDKMKRGLEMESKAKDIEAIEWKWRTPVELDDKREEVDDELESNVLHMMANHFIPTPSSRVNTKNEETPADLIAKELMELEITDKVSDESNKPIINSKTNGDDIFRLSNKFCDSLLLQHEDHSNKSTHKNVYQPSKRLETQGIQQQNLFAPNSANKSSKQSWSSGTVEKTADHPQFGVKSKPVFVLPRKIDLKSDHTSTLWTQESSATGPRRSFREEALSQTILIPVRESLQREREYHDQHKKNMRQYAANSLLLPARKIYRYRDVGERKSLFDELGTFDPHYLVGDVGVETADLHGEEGGHSDSDSYGETSDGEDFDDDESEEEFPHLD